MQDFMIFNNLDSLGESQKISNAQFSDFDPNEFAKFLESDDFEALIERRAGVSEDVGTITVERQKSMEKFLKLQRLEKAVYRNLDNYVLPINITPKAAAEFVEVIRRRGKLASNSLHKLLGRAYRSLRRCPNISKVDICSSDKLTVVGDLHGQLDDLLYILDTFGFPSLTHKYIFNGDFVDRGDRGVEVMCVLLVLFLGMPGSVYLNRGNHEDFSVCCLYGFQGECCEKYDETIFGMFSELFQQIPLFAIVNNSVFVVHGGLFHSDDVTIDDLDKIDRSNFSLRDVQGFYYHCNRTKDLLREKEKADGLEPDAEAVRLSEVELQVLVDAEEGEEEMRASHRLQRLQLDALWSDPNPTLSGVAYNPRGVSIQYGPDVTRQFLQRNGLKMVVRSHECVQDGFDLPFAGDHRGLLATIFSASDYGGGKNTGAVMCFSTTFVDDPSSPLMEVPGVSLWYQVHHYTVRHTVVSSKEKSDKSEPTLGIVETIKLHQVKLLEAFKAVDVEGRGEVSKLTWADVMQRVTHLKIRWLTMIPFIVAEEFRQSGEINYNAFIKFIVENDFA